MRALANYPRLLLAVPDWIGVGSFTMAIRGDGDGKPNLPMPPPQTQTNKQDAPKRRSLPPSNLISIRIVAILLAGYLGLGTLCFYLARHQMTGKKTNQVLDSLYFCVVTMTTVGYGDFTPNSATTKLLTCALALMGTSLGALVLSEAIDSLAEKQKKLLVKALQRRRNNDQEGGQNNEKRRLRNRASNTHNCLKAIVVMLLLVVVGVIFFVKVEKMGFVDALYVVCCTVTTVGYGDKSFETKAGRVFAVVWILLSTLCLAKLLVFVAEVKNERRHRELVNWVIGKKMSQEDFEAADLDHDGVLSDAEFVLHKLREMGKINEEDVSIVMKSRGRDDAQSLTLVA